MTQADDLNNQIAQNLKNITAEFAALQEKLQALKRQLEALESQTAHLASTARPKLDGQSPTDK